MFIKNFVMKTLYSLVLISIIIVYSQCNFTYKRIKGNGNISSETKEVSQSGKIKISGNFNVFIDSGAASVKVETDENLISKIRIYNDEGWLIIKPEKYKNLIPSSDIKIYITTPQLKSLKLAGKCDAKSIAKLLSNEEIIFDIAGSGNLDFNIHAPDIKISIAGSGDVFLMGETRNVDLNIAGNGDFKGFDLKAENVDVSIAGNGDAQIFSSNTLKVKIAGNGSIKYKGNPTIDKKIMGNGSITHSEN